MTVYSRNHGEVTEAEAQVSRSSRQLKLEAMSAIESEKTRSCDGEDQKQLCLLDKGCDATDYRMEPNLDCSVVVTRKKQSHLATYDNSARLICLKFYFP